MLGASAGSGYGTGFFYLASFLGIGIEAVYVGTRLVYIP